MVKIMENYQRLIPLILDYQIDLCMVGAGVLSMPQQINLSQELIVNLAKLRAAMSMDLYAK